jgi:hypothetical protein
LGTVEWVHREAERAVIDATCGDVLPVALTRLDRHFLAAGGPGKKPVF